MSEPGWTDTHCHLQLLDNGSAAVTDARAAGVDRVVCVGIDAATSQAAVDAAAAHDNVFATAGLHPHEARHLDAQWLEIEDLANTGAVVAIGECGLDFYRDHSPHFDQEMTFRRQIKLAKQLDLALVIHTREAWDATFDVLDDEGAPERFVFHCFSGTPDDARRCLAFGAYISIAGPISYPKNDVLRDAARSVPLDRLVVETDAPFLSPQAFRGKTNYPSRVALVGEALAETLGREPAEVAAATSANATELFRLDSHVA